MLTIQGEGFDAYNLSKRNSNFIKGVAVILVLVAHYSQWYLGNMNQVPLIFLLTKTGRYGVSLFFAISGYGLVLSAEKGLDKSFIKRRLMNVYIPYLLIHGITLAFQGGQFGVQEAIYFLLCLDAWFICVIILFYVLFYFVWKYITHKVLVLSFGVLVLSIILASIMKDNVWYASNFSFIVGTMMSFYRKKYFELMQNKGKTIVIVAGLSFFASAVIYAVYMDINNLIYLTFKIIASAIWSFLFISFYILIKMPNCRLIEKIGVASLECYLIHMSILQAVCAENTNIAGMVLSVIITLLVSIVVHGLYHSIIFKSITASIGSRS